jgi:hypothetical protein
MNFGDPLQLPVVFVACGLGLAAAGLLNALLPRRWCGADSAIVFFAAAIAIIVAALGSSSALAIVIGAVAASTITIRVVRSESFGTAMAAAAATLRSPRVRWIAVGMIGASLLVFGVTSIDRSGNFEDAQSLARLENLPKPETRAVAYAHSDCGSAIALRVATDDRPPERLQEFEHSVLQDHHWTDHVIRKLPATDDCNCHGWVFAGGHYWLEADDVECVLSENGYQSVTAPQVGDLVIYRNDAGAISHSGLVRALLPDGVPIVESKWCWMGVFLHQVGDTDYGSNFTYYRTDRGSHLMAGLPADKTYIQSQRTD